MLRHSGESEAHKLDSGRSFGRLADTHRIVVVRIHVLDDSLLCGSFLSFWGRHFPGGDAETVGCMI